MPMRRCRSFVVVVSDFGSCYFQKIQKANFVAKYRQKQQQKWGSAVSASCSVQNRTPLVSRTTNGLDPRGQDSHPPLTTYNSNQRASFCFAIVWNYFDQPQNTTASDILWWWWCYRKCFHFHSIRNKGIMELTCRRFPKEITGMKMLKFNLFWKKSSAMIIYLRVKP